MDKKRRNILEKTLFSLLGKAPGSFLAVLDEDGWLSVKEIHRILQARKGCGFLTPATIRQFVDLYMPERFELRDNMIRVRPEYMEPGLLVHEYVSPPDRLYVPVRPKAHAHVMKNGLLPPSNRKWIVLAAGKKDAEALGKRRDAAPITGEVDCIVAERLGVCFFRADGPLYLVDRLPSACITLPPLPEEAGHDNIAKERSESRKKKETASGMEKPSTPLPGSFFPGTPPSFIKSEKGRKGRKKEPEWKQKRRRAKKYTGR
jgi:RNA:NAD 2'-phosphotransferase (TPT1/KptA family)